MISFTADIWSDHNRRSYLCVTAHWISRDMATKSLAFRNALIAFHRLVGGHDGKSLAQALLQILDRAGITAQVCNLFNVIKAITEITLGGSFYIR
jgi:hypothetical protein